MLLCLSLHYKGYNCTADKNLRSLYEVFVRVGAKGAIAPVDFENNSFAPVDFPKTFRKIENLTVLTGLGSCKNDLHPSFETHYGAPE